MNSTGSFIIMCCIINIRTGYFLFKFNEKIKAFLSPTHLPPPDEVEKFEVYAPTTEFFFVIIIIIIGQLTSHF